MWKIYQSDKGMPKECFNNVHFRPCKLQQLFANVTQIENEKMFELISSVLLWLNFLVS